MRRNKSVLKFHFKSSSTEAAKSPLQKYKIGTLLVCAVAFAFTFSGCAAKKTPKPSRQTAPAIERFEVKQKPSKPRIGNQNAQTPERSASNSLIENGNAKLAEGDAQKASIFFRDAIKVDPSNGPAYYYLSFSYFKMQETEMAKGLLEKAENLLSHDKEWLRKIEELKFNLETPF
jgi:Tfp pilus assembly protein PilF